MTDRQIEHQEDRVIRADAGRDSRRDRRRANKMGYHKATDVTVPLHRELRQDFIDARRDGHPQGARTAVSARWR